MKSRDKIRLAACAALVGFAAFGNPIFDGWYADPQIRRYGDTYWVFPTISVSFANQTSFKVSYFVGCALFALMDGGGIWYTMHQSSI